ncbi:aminoglycoside phosphotransferase family protein [Winogradskya humida]|uniref:Aminoglycoside phosphotransferase n=1 Tax=Winogradskya humida TaxID=113566 RepID=A0ABQ3ZGC0_9ACTN|nr:aminoglycoside phosphotransferase family protein [Actinoplanes humidus]GIE17625.1 aminoglycoside phosphotransferase [Actinoplanes humidus]
MSYRPPIDTALVRKLVDTQFPQWADLPLTLLDPAGSDHVIHRLGPALTVRLPRHDGAIGQATKDLTWLPRLAPHLPLTIPSPVAVGTPDLGYPWPWAVTRWLPGEVATTTLDTPETALALADFLLALQAIPPSTGLASDPLSDRDKSCRANIAAAADTFDAAALTEVWNAALAAPAWTRPPVLFHGDFHTGNLLTENGHLTAVIDFGGLGAGDPSPDLTIAFTLLSAKTRPIFRNRLAIDDATWARGRGWSLAGGINAFVSYAHTNPRIATATTRQITETLKG